MKIKRKTMNVATIVAGALVVGIVVAPGSAVAANGKALILGATNYATSGTWISRTNGTPLGLKGSTAYPPMVVNSSKTVTHLSADMVDGISSGSFARTAGKTGVVTDKDWSDNYGAKCPSGTVATGGGGITPYSALGYNGPDFNATDDGRLVFIPNSWVVIDSEGYVEPSFVTCYSPTGSVPGASTSMANPYAGLTAMAPGDSAAPRHSASNLKASAGK